MGSDILFCLQIEERTNVHDVIPFNFLKHRWADENLQDNYFEMAKCLYAPVNTLTRNSISQSK